MKINIVRVIEDREGFAAISLESPFYPDGKGGQLGDRGKIGEATVKRVLQKKDGIYHIVDRKLKPGEYEIWIDERRRKDIAKQHTAQHILSAAFVKIAEIETASFHMGEDFSTIDLEAAPILKEVIDEAEDLANSIVMECKRVIEHLISKDEASRFPLRKPISDKIKGTIRIIEVEGFDWSACGGFHVKNTGEIGVIKIIDYEKVKGSLTRIYFVAGEKALKDYRKRVDTIQELSAMLTTSLDEVKQRISNILEDAKKKGSELEKVSEELAKLVSKRLKEEAVNIGNVKLVYYDGYESVGKYVFKYLGDEEGLLLVVKTKNGYELGSSTINIEELIRKLLDEIEGRGGGGKKRGRIMTSVSWNEFKNVIDKVLNQ